MSDRTLYVQMATIDLTLSEREIEQRTSARLAHAREKLQGRLIAPHQPGTWRPCLTLKSTV
jgi:hypothetical protein